tara:strand:+ start:261 stop:470 length:210 start_codon:yes stop_codon:yes gene_type:complete
MRMREIHQPPPYLSEERETEEEGRGGAARRAVSGGCPSAAVAGERKEAKGVALLHAGTLVRPAVHRAER